MIRKQGTAKIIRVANRLERVVRKGLRKIAASIDFADKDDLLFLRNRAISSLEVHGPNDNFDGFPDIELQKSYSTFIKKPVTLDHQEDVVIGVVLHSEYVPLPDSTLAKHLYIPRLASKEEKLDRLITLYNQYSAPEKQILVELVADEVKLDPETHNYFEIFDAFADSLTRGAYVENIWALSIPALKNVDQNLPDALLEGKITDTSMGCEVEESVCSLCGHIAYTDDELCEHILFQKGTVVGSTVVYEICRGLTFYEDSLILPKSFGGKAGGRGADPAAKIAEKWQ